MVPFRFTISVATFRRPICRVLLLLLLRNSHAGQRLQEKGVAGKYGRGDFVIFSSRPRRRRPFDLSSPTIAGALCAIMQPASHPVVSAPDKDGHKKEKEMTMMQMCLCLCRARSSACQYSTVTMGAGRRSHLLSKPRRISLFVLSRHEQQDAGTSRFHAKFFLLLFWPAGHENGRHVLYPRPETV